MIMMSSCMNSKPPESFSYAVGRLGESIVIDANWDKDVWRNVKSVSLRNFMGPKSDHHPDTQVKLGYDDENIYVIFQVKDRYVLSKARNFHDPVCRDSCVEFFFTPGGDISQGYFNLEINCGGSALFSYHKVPRDNGCYIDVMDMEKIEISSTLPRVVDPEITEPITWNLEYRLPVSILETFCPMERPAQGVAWRANFYKCADKSSHGHYLTWTFVDHPEPDFHLPQFFGRLEFA